MRGNRFRAVPGSAGVPPADTLRGRIGRWRPLPQSGGGSRRGRSPRSNRREPPNLRRRLFNPRPVLKNPRIAWLGPWGGTQTRRLPCKTRRFRRGSPGFVMKPAGFAEGVSGWIVPPPGRPEKDLLPSPPVAPHLKAASASTDYRRSAPPERALCDIRMSVSDRIHPGRTAASTTGSGNQGGPCSGRLCVAFDVFDELKQAAYACLKL